MKVLSIIPPIYKNNYISGMTRSIFTKFGYTSRILHIHPYKISLSVSWDSVLRLYMIRFWLTLKYQIPRISDYKNVTIIIIIYVRWKYQLIGSSVPEIWAFIWKVSCQAQAVSTIIKEKVHHVTAKILQ